MADEHDSRDSPDDLYPFALLSVTTSWSFVREFSREGLNWSPLPRLRPPVFFRLRLRLSLQNTGELLNPDSLTHPGT